MENEKKERGKEHKKLRILAAGDLHGDQRLAEKLAKRAEKEKVDLVIICGDITQFDQSTENMMKPFVERNEKVIIIPGNHESVATADFLAEFYGVTNLHGYSIQAGDVGLFGCGGANIGVAQMSEDEIYNLIKKGFDKVKNLKKKILVTHVHPADSKMEKFTQFFPGSKGVKKAIDKLKPDILLCSHVHEAEGIEEKIGKTKVINVGKKGKIIEI
jgi:Icc-related predicted phosphoesterase